MNKNPFDELNDRVSDMLRRTPVGDIEKNLKALLAGFFDRMDLVNREDFEIQKRLVEQLEARTAALEARLASLEARQGQAPHGAR